MGQLQFPDGVDIESFLYLFWEKKPLLMKGALPNFGCPLDENELAGLACEPEIESRLVMEKGGPSPWFARFGPFNEEDYANLADSHWTLLVQDVDKYDPEVASLLDYFRFIPDWRIDDVMISYATDQGSVGPHYDEYDVFLYQAKGRRRWQISTAPVSEDNFIPDIDLRILPDFQAEKEWILEPGDILYLPPRVAHWGVSLGESLGYSVGIRADRNKDLANSFFQDVIEKHIPSTFYRDSSLTQQESSAEIKPEALTPLISQFESLLQLDINDLQRWFGRFVTEQKYNLVVYPLDDAINPDEFLNAFSQQNVLSRNSYSRLAFSMGQNDVDYLYANGKEYTLPTGNRGFLHAITQTKTLPFAYLNEWLNTPECTLLLSQLVNDGHYEFGEQ